MKSIRYAVVFGITLALFAQLRAADKPAKSEKVDGMAVEFTGKLETGVVAIGGETTGTTITANGKTYELDFTKNPKLQDFAATLNQKDVSIKGTLNRKAGVEIHERWIITVADLLAKDASKPVKDDAAADAIASKSFVYKKTKQADLEMVVHYPPGWKETDKRPGIVFFFGGGWTSGKIGQFEPQATHLASRGMVAARADYRVKSRHDVSPKECVEDAKSAVRWMRHNAGKLGVDPDRIVAAGGSAGGHIAACTALTPGLEADGEDVKISSKPNAMVLFNPVLRFSGIPQLMGRIDNDEALGKAISPTLHLKKDSPPTLLFFGTADRLAAQGNEFMKKSKELGHKAELFTAEGQGHGFFNRPPWLEKTAQRMDEFLVSIGYLEKKSIAAKPTGTKTSFKGWELYVWQENGDTYFSLLEGTNRLKTDKEIVQVAVKGFDAIKPKLAELKLGEFLTICGRRLLEQPPKDQATPVVEYGRKIGLKVQ